MGWLTDLGEDGNEVLLDGLVNDGLDRHDAFRGRSRGGE